MCTSEKELIESVPYLWFTFAEDNQQGNGLCTQCRSVECSDTEQCVCVCVCVCVAGAWCVASCVLGPLGPPTHKQSDVYTWPSAGCLSLYTACSHPLQCSHVSLCKRQRHCGWVFVCLCHVPSCCCSCLHPSPVPNHPVCLYYWFLLCPVNSPCLVHLCLCLPRLDCFHLSLVICCLCVCVYIVLVFLFLVASSEIIVIWYVPCFFPLFLVFQAFSAFHLVKVITRASDLCLPYNYSPAYSLFGFVCLLLDCLPVYRTLLVNVYSSESTPVLSRAIEFCTTPTIRNNMSSGFRCSFILLSL